MEIADRWMRRKDASGGQPLTSPGTTSARSNSAPSPMGIHLFYIARKAPSTNTSNSNILKYSEKMRRNSVLGSSIRRRTTLLDNYTSISLHHFTIELWPWLVLQWMNKGTGSN